MFSLTVAVTISAASPETVSGEPRTRPYAMEVEAKLMSTGECGISGRDVRLNRCNNCALAEVEVV